MIKKIICSLILGSAFLTSLQADTITDTRIGKATGRLEALSGYVKSNPESVLSALNGTFGGNAAGERSSKANPSFLVNSTDIGGPLACQYEGKDATVTPILTDVDFAALKVAADKSADNKAVVPYTAKGAKAQTHDLVVWGEKALGKKDLICYIPVVRN